MTAVARAGEEFRKDLRAPGARNAQARRLLTPPELAPLTQLSAWRSLAAIAQTVGLIAAAIAFAAATWPSAWIIASIVVIGIAQHGLFILAHEAAHYRLFAHRGVNDIVGLNAWKTFAYFFGSPAINDDTRRAIRPLDDTSPQLRAAARRDRWWVVGFHVAAPLAAWVLGGGQALLLYLLLWALPLLTVLQPVLRLRAILEHGAVEDLGSPLTAARTNRTWGGPLNWLARAVLFPHHVNYHLEHHLYPAVPHYHLPRLHRLLQEKGALQDAEVRDVRGTWERVYAARRRRD